MVRQQIPGMRVRARARFRKPDMTIGVDEPDLREYADNTRFNTLVDGIAADPSGRGPVPAASPLAARPVQPDDLDMAFTPQEVEKREAAPRSPSGLLSGGRAFDNMPNPVVIGDAVMTRRREAPPAPPEPEPSITSGQPAKPAADEYAPQPETKITAEANTRPDYGRVSPEQIAPTSAGDKPPGGDKWLAAARGVGSLLMSAGGDSKGGMREGMNAYSDFQDQEREAREYSAKQAELDAGTAREQRGENRYATETNYGRARDEDSTARQNTNDKFAQDDRLAQRGFMQRGEDRAVASDAYDRDPNRRKEALDDYEGKKRIDAKYARRAGAGGGRADQASRDAAYKSMLSSAQELYPDGVPQNVQNEIALRAMDKNPIDAATAFTSKLRGDVATRGDKTAARAATEAKAGVKAQQAAAEVEGADSGLANLEAALVRKLERGEQTLPNTTPGAGLARGAAGVVKQIAPKWAGGSFEAPKRNPGESDKDWAAREGDFKSGAMGPQGYSQDDSTINSFGALYARGLYYDTAGNSANLKSEADVADATVRSNGTVQGMLEQVRKMRARLGKRKETGQFIQRDKDGNVIADEPQQPAFQRVRAADGSEIEVTD